MKKRLLLSLTLSGALLLSTALASEGARFTDVASDAWYAPYVEVCAREGVMNGTGNNAFSPEKVLTNAEAAVLAARIHTLCRGGDGTFEQAPADWGLVTIRLSDGTSRTDYVGPGCFTAMVNAKGGPDLAIRLTEAEQTWAAGLDGQAAWVDLPDGGRHKGTVSYDAQAGTLTFYTSFGATSNAYIAAMDIAMAIPTPLEWARDAAWYLEENGLFRTQGFFFDQQPSTRLNFALAIAACVGELEAVRQVSSPPDLNNNASYREKIIPLYAAGILTGVDSYGTFLPEGELSRAECAAVSARIFAPELRVTTQQKELPEPLGELGLAILLLLPVDEVTLADGDTTLLYTADGRVLDWTGALVYDLSAYDQYDPFLSDGVARVQKDGLYGYVNQHTGTEIVPCRYEAATEFHDGVLLAGSEADGFTAFDRTGNVLGRLDGSVNYSNTAGKLIQYQDSRTGLYGYVNPDGTVAVQAAYTAVYPFSNGYAAVRDDSGLAGFIDTQGTLVIDCRFDLVTEGFTYSGYAVVGTAGTTPNPLHYDGKLGLINTAGELVVPMEYDYLQNVSDGLALFARIEEDGTVVKGYLSPDGTEHVPELLASLPENQLPAPFVNGRAPFLDGDLQGLMNTQFEVVLPAAFERCISGSSGGQAVVLLDGMWYQVKL